MLVLVSLCFSADGVNVLVVYWHVVWLIICHHTDLIVITAGQDTAQ